MCDRKCCRNIEGKGRMTGEAEETHQGKSDAGGRLNREVNCCWEGSRRVEGNKHNI